MITKKFASLLLMLCVSGFIHANGFDKLQALQKQFVPAIGPHQIEGATGQAPEVPYVCGLLSWHHSGKTFWDARLHGIATNKNFVSQGINFEPLNAYDKYAATGHSALGIAAQERVFIAVPARRHHPQYHPLLLQLPPAEVVGTLQQLQAFS